MVWRIILALVESLDEILHRVAIFAAFLMHFLDKSDEDVGI